MQERFCVAARHMSCLLLLWLTEATSGNRATAFSISADSYLPDGPYKWCAADRISAQRLPETSQKSWEAPTMSLLADIEVNQTSNCDPVGQVTQISRRRQFCYILSTGSSPIGCDWDSLCMIETSVSYTCCIKAEHNIFWPGPKYSNVVLRISPEVGREILLMLTRWTNAFSSIFSSCFPIHICLSDARIVTDDQEVAATGSLAYLLCWVYMDLLQSNILILPSLPN